MTELLSRVVLGQEVREWAIAGIVVAASIVLAILVRWVAGSVLNARLRRLEELTASAAPQDDEETVAAPGAPQLEFAVRLIRSFLFPALIIGGLAAATRTLAFATGIATILNASFVILFSLVIIRFLTTVINELFRRAATRTEGVDLTRVRPLRAIIVFVVWIAGLLFLLSNLGFDVSAIIAALGITGIAVALAAQAVLGDLFSYFVILLDRPFEIGDFIVSREIVGSVERIGVKTTKIRAIGGEQIVVGNASLTGGWLKNFKRLEKRLVVFKLGLAHETSVEKLRAVPGILAEIVGREEQATFLRANFAEYSDWSLIIEVVYQVLIPDYTEHMNIKERINLGIHESFKEHGIAFAFPRRSVRIDGGTG